MNAIQIHIHGRYIQGSCELVYGKYHDGNPAIVLRQQGQIAAKVTVNLDDQQREQARLGPLEFAVKNWSENAGIIESLVDLGILEHTGRSVQCGHCSAPICQFTQQGAIALCRQRAASASVG